MVVISNNLIVSGVSSNIKTIDWLDDNEIDYDILDYIMTDDRTDDSISYIPDTIRFINEEDYFWFILTWS